MVIAITGATGFLGKYLVNHLKSNNHKIIVVSRPEEQAGKIFHDIKTVECDYSTIQLEDAFKDVDVVIHLVAQTLQRDSDPLKISQFYNVNVKLLENVLFAANQHSIKKVIQMSSNNVYSAKNKIPFSENQIPVPSSIYGLSKRFAEVLGSYFSDKTDLKVISLRLARLFGYGERDTVVFTKYMKLAIQKETLEVWGEGKTSIDYLYVRDAVEAIEKACTTNLESGIYNVGSNKAYAVKEIAETINEICQNQGNLIFDYAKKEGGYFIKMDSSKFYKLTCWKPRWKLKEAIMEMYSYYK